jgi:hypothetical protein
MVAPQYVHVDVLSDYPVSRMLYDTLHNDTDTPQYVHADAPSDFFLL